MVAESAPCPIAALILVMLLSLLSSSTAEVFARILAVTMYGVTYLQSRETDYRRYTSAVSKTPSSASTKTIVSFCARKRRFSEDSLFSVSHEQLDERRSAQSEEM
ncbi:hypothetical protein BaRGS_00029988 [Batillaria attramentaria]|uniref:Secreted protein n=1 Tax=Batillaria attramentaria TaxID=370345 RepID=A0ABD0JUP5_9CAEN